MKNLKKLIEEHKELNGRIERLEDFIYNLNNSLLIMDNKTQSEAKRDCLEYANLTIQLRGMKMYIDALTARLLNKGVIIKDGHYMTEVE